MRQREFRLLFSSQAISLLGDGIAPVALAFAVLGLTGDPAALGLVLAARMVPMLGLLLAGGVLGDRRSRRSAMVVADVVRAASQAATAGLLITGVAEVWELAVLQAVHGAATAVFMPACSGLVPTVVRPEALQQANALRGIARSGGLLAGPAVAAVLVTTVGAGWALAVDAATFAVSALVLTRLPAAGSPATAAAAASRSFRTDLSDGWRAFRGRTWIWAGVAAASATNMLFAAYLVLGPAVADSEMGGAADWALMTAALGAGMLLGGLGGLRVRPVHPLRLFAALLALPAGPVLALAAGASAPVVAVWAGLAGFGLALLNAIWETTLQREVPDAVLSRVTAYDWLGSFGLQPVGYVLAGVLASTVGLHETLLVVGVLFTGTAVALLAVEDVRGLRVSPRAVGTAGSRIFLNGEAAPCHRAPFAAAAEKSHEAA